MAPSKAQAPVVVNDTRRSRKWALAKASLGIATIGAVVMETAALTLAFERTITGEIWREVAIGLLYWWLFVDMAVLSGYGITNVIEKWAPKGGGA